VAVFSGTGRRPWVRAVLTYLFQWRHPARQLGHPGVLGGPFVERDRPEFPPLKPLPLPCGSSRFWGRDSGEILPGSLSPRLIDFLLSINALLRRKISNCLQFGLKSNATNALFAGLSMGGWGQSWVDLRGSSLCSCHTQLHGKDAYENAGARNPKPNWWPSGRMVVRWGAVLYPA